MTLPDTLPSFREILTVLFVFGICLLVFGSFLFCIWYDIRARMWSHNFERDTITTIAEIYLHREDAEDGITAIHYRFSGPSGKTYSGAQTLHTRKPTPRYGVGNKIKVHYYIKFPSMFSYIDGHDTSFKHSSRFIGFFVFVALMFWWFFS